ncbi:ECF transporter S component [Vagococcus vulneris]|uniref:Riboflavin transporter n=1 Tax=Vagococcus vulneris TaxID=1977869 RepID=A0A430A204_9ENTE|nr:ECF transporter S component [Vagococcus vulneris]RSU00468.1 ECF transporter S component [Vagococcus vulneris]
MRKSKTEKMVVIAVLSAMAYVLMLISFPVIPVFSWLKVDFSDIPVLIGTFIYGPLGGIATAFIRSGLHFITTGGDLPNLIGDTTAFVASVVFLLPIYKSAQVGKTGKNLIIGMISSTLLLTVFMAVANYFVITPLYLNLLGMDFGMPIATMVLYGIIPFNLIKGVMVSVVFAVVYKKVLPILERRVHKLAK